MLEGFLNFMSNYLLEYEKELTAITPSVIEDRFAIFFRKRITNYKAKWIKDRWLKGEKTDGNIIGVYASLWIMNCIRSLGRTGTVDLTFSGDMGDLIDGSYNNMEMEIFSTVPYYEKIVKKYGYENFNITDEEKEILLSIRWRKCNKLLFLVNYGVYNLWRGIYEGPMKRQLSGILSKFMIRIIVRWVYVQQGNVKVTRNYKTIPKGVEYFHISEWNG